MVFACDSLIAALSAHSTLNGLTRIDSFNLAGNLSNAFIAQGSGRCVRRDGNLGMLPKSMVLRQRLDPEHIQSGAGHVTFLQQVQQILFNQMFAARHIDEKCARLQL